MDLSLYKNFALGEDKTFDARADFFNAFNHAIFNAPNGNHASEWWRWPGNLGGDGAADSDWIPLLVLAIHATASVPKGPTSGLARFFPASTQIPWLKRFINRRTESIEGMVAILGTGHKKTFPDWPGDGHRPRIPGRSGRDNLSALGPAEVEP